MARGEENPAYRTGRNSKHGQSWMALARCCNRAARYIKMPPKIMQASILIILDMSMLKKKARVNMPATQESPYIAMWALIGFLLTACQINHPMKASDKIIPIAVNIKATALLPESASLTKQTTLLREWDSPIDPNQKDISRTLQLDKLRQRCIVRCRNRIKYKFSLA